MRENYQFRHHKAIRYTIMKNIGRIVLVLLSLSIAGYAASFLNFKIQGILLGKGDLIHALPYLTAFYVHVGLGGFALAIGPFQFFPKWRARHLQFHRTLGKLYVGACLLSGAAGLIIAFFASGGLGTKTGFALLAVSWLITTSTAFIQIRKGRVEEHRRWMIRSFAVTLAAVTLRIFLPLMLVSGVDFPMAYGIISWACWIPNLILAEWLIQSTLTSTVSGVGAIE